MSACPHCNDEGVVCGMDGSIIGPCDCVNGCRYCGIVPGQDLPRPSYHEMRTERDEAVRLLRAQPFNACPGCGLNAGRGQLPRVLCGHSWHERNDDVRDFLAGVASREVVALHQEGET